MQKGIFFEIGALNPFFTQPAFKNNSSYNLWAIDVGRQSGSITF